MSEKKMRRTGDIPRGVREFFNTLLHGKDRGADRPRVSYFKPEAEDPWEMKVKRKPGIKVKGRALRRPDREGRALRRPDRERK